MPPELMDLVRVVGAFAMLYGAVHSICTTLWKIYKWLTLKRTKKGE